MSILILLSTVHRPLFTDMEEELPRPAATPPNLEKMSVVELQNHIESMKAEIARAEAMIKSKQSVRAGAEALFKK